jgi:hypothetical protein
MRFIVKKGVRKEAIGNKHRENPMKMQEKKRIPLLTNLCK